jgi:hypothetical protein
MEIIALKNGPMIFSNLKKINKLMSLFSFPKLKKIKLLDHLGDNCH